MTYKVIGIMSGSSLDGLDITYTHFNRYNDEWHFDIVHAECVPIEAKIKDKLRQSTLLQAYEYLKLDVEYGLFIGRKINEFIHKLDLSYKVDFVAVHGHTTFHSPSDKVTHQIGDIHAIGSLVGVPVISHFRNLDVMKGGQGAPIVPLGEKLLFKDIHAFLNLGGIANISFHKPEKTIAYDICSCNSVLNYLSDKNGFAYDNKGLLSKQGVINHELLNQLNALPYYTAPPPKSLSNEWAKVHIISYLEHYSISIQDLLRTYIEHISIQISKEIQKHRDHSYDTIYVTGGGTFNTFLIENLSQHIARQSTTITIPEHKIVEFKEAMIIGFLGVLRWREEHNTLSTITGAFENSINGIILQPS